MKKLGAVLHHQLLRPTRVFVFCAGFAFVSLMFNGGLINLYSLRRDKLRLVDQLKITKAQIVDLDGRLQQAKDPAFMERQALDRYELADEHDLVFVFAEE